AAGIAQVRAREGSVTDDELAAFLQAPAAEIPRLRGAVRSPAISLARVIGATRLTHRVARDLYDRHHPDLMVLYLAGTDEIGHLFAPSMPPKLPCASEEDVGRYGGVVDDYYALVDRVLGQWMRRAREDGATLLIHSDHGFLWGERRLCDVAAHDWNTASFWHRPEGVFLAWGERVRPGRAPAAVSLFDVAPTVSALLGIPVDPSLRGRPFTSAFTDLRPSARRSVLAAVDVRRLPAEPVSDAEADEYARKLIALGYISGADTRAVAPAPGDRPGRTEGAWNHLGLYYRETVRDGRAARAAFENALAVRPDYASPMFNLAILSRRSGDSTGAEEWLWRSIAARLPDPDGTILRWAIEDLRADRVARAEKVLRRGVEQFPRSERLAQQLAFIRFQERDCAGAVAALSRFEASTREADTLNSLGMYHACLGARGVAAGFLRRSLSVRPDQPEVLESLRKLEGASR
ncbi:MAG: alkaline phosphatase family protein, partial [Thermoanaerobaculia bacterium]